MMNFTDRDSSGPIKITLKDSNGNKVTYEVESIEVQGGGTPLNASTFAAFRQDIIDQVSQMGIKGDRGPQGNAGTYITGIRISRV